MSGERPKRRRDVIIANHAEFNRRWMYGFRGAERWPWDTGAHALADQSLFWGGSSAKTVFTRTAPDPRLVAAASDALGGAEIETVGVGCENPFLSRAILGDEQLLALLEERLGKEGGGRLLAWGLTPGLASLIKELRARGCDFTTPELPDPAFAREARWRGSKVGARRLLEAGGVAMAEGVIVTSPGEAAEAARYLAQRGHGAVIKANEGSGGFAVRAYPPEKILERSDYVSRDIEVRGKLDGAWRSPLLIVERLVEREPGFPPYAPTVDWLIDSDGAAECMGVGLMAIRRGSLYSGVVAGVGALDGSVEAECLRIGARVAGILSARGYRGWFDVDLVADAAGAVYVTELNLRRTCPAHAYELARARKGDRWAGVSAIESVDRLDLGPGSGVDYGRLSEEFASFNAEWGDEGVFAVATGVTDCLTRPRPELGFAVTAPDAQRARSASLALADRLRRSTK